MSSISRTRLLVAAIIAIAVLLIPVYMAVIHRPDGWQQSVKPASEVRGALSFSVPKREPVAMGVTDSARYQLRTVEGAQEFAKLLPSGGHIVYVSESRLNKEGDYEIVPVPYTVTLFHQFKCLDIIRDQLNRSSSPISSMTRHCMNYLRQTIICRPNLTLESAKTSTGVASRTYDAVCQDWTGLYDEAERNHKAYVAWMADNNAEEYDSHDM